MRVAVVGTGISGLVAAYQLRHDHDLTIFESDSRVGGHANTVEVSIEGKVHAVDTGFIVYNEPNYPGFSAILRELNVATQPTQMSFSVSDQRTGLEYCGTNLNTLFAQRRNALRPQFLKLLVEIARFNRAARKLVDGEPSWQGADRLPANRCSDSNESETLAEFATRGGYSTALVEQFLIPFGASIWSADPATFADFPARSYARFMNNHGLLDPIPRPSWRTISGGSQSYVKKLTASLANRIRVSTPVHKIASRRDTDGTTQVELVSERGLECFDRVVIATHSDQALRILADPSPAELSILGAISYQRNVATLHTDERLLPRAVRARASWNYRSNTEARRAVVTYWMNRLQSLDSNRAILVTLNAVDSIDPAHVLAEFDYDHPVFNMAALGAQRRQHEIQGVGGRYYAGAYWGYGFHEDGVQSGLEAARAIGCRQ